MARKIIFKRGLKKNLPTLSAGEMALATDTKETFIGNEDGKNIRIMNENDVKDFVANDVIGDLSQLKTNDKSSLTASANEIIKRIEDIETPVNSEAALRKALDDGYTSIVLNKDIILNEPVHFDGVSIRFNLNGFGITLSDDYPDDVSDFIFSVGYMEDFISVPDHQRTSKQFFNGFIDCNDKKVSVFKYYFSWDFKCKDLRIERCALGFITYYPESDLLDTKGAEGILDNIVINTSYLHTEDNIGFDIDFGDFTGVKLFPTGFTIGILNRGSGNRFTDCHPWGMPANFYKNRRTGICFADFGYNNYYTGCTADTPELLDVNLPASYDNGGIGFYSENSISIRFSNCDILLSSGSKDDSIIGWYFNKPAILENKYYGGGVSLTTCTIRGTESKISKPIHFTGGRSLPLIECNFSAESVIRQFNSFNSYSTIFKVPTATAEGDLDLFEIPDNNAFKIFNVNGIMTFLYNDANNQQSNYFLRPFVHNSYYETATLIPLRDQLKAEKRVNGLTDRTGTVTTILKKWNNSRNAYDRFLIYWDRDDEKFYYAYNNAEVIF